jgi:hypothetical protein
MHHPEVVEKLAILNAPHPRRFKQAVFRPRLARRSWSRGRSPDWPAWRCRGRKWPVKRGDPHLGGPRPSEDQACVAGGRSVKLKVSALRLPSLSDITQGSEKNSASKRVTSSEASCWTQCDVSNT